MTRNRSFTVDELLADLAAASTEPEVLLWLWNTASERTARTAATRLPLPVLLENAPTALQRSRLFSVLEHRHLELTEQQAASLGRIHHAAWCALRANTDSTPLVQLLRTSRGRNAFQELVLSPSISTPHLSESTLVLVIERATFPTVAALLSDRLPWRSSVTRAAVLHRLRDCVNSPSRYAVPLLAAVMCAPADEVSAQLVKRVAPLGAMSIVERWSTNAPPPRADADPAEHRYRALATAAGVAWLSGATTNPSLHSDAAHLLATGALRTPTEFLAHLATSVCTTPSPLRFAALQRLGARAWGVLSQVQHPSEEETAQAIMSASPTSLQRTTSQIAAELERRWLGLPLASRVAALRRAVDPTVERPLYLSNLGTAVLQSDTEALRHFSIRQLAVFNPSPALLIDDLIAFSRSQLQLFLAVLDANPDTPLRDLLEIARTSAP